jgi:hypothetical protein
VTTAEHALDVPFRLRDRDGTVHVEVAPNTDPVEVGHPLVAVGYDEQKFRGFPVVTASVEYDGIGFRAWMGWLQVIERHDDDGTTTESVDIPPLFEGSPLYTLGYLPTFCDCPGNPDHPDGDWVAHAFLVAIPDVVRTRRLYPVAGFRWGYRLVDGRPVDRFAPITLDFDAWESHRSLLESEYPDWAFLPAEAPS